MFVSPDAGGAVRAPKFADMFYGDVAIVDKRRPKAGVSEVMALIGDVKHKHAIPKLMTWLIVVVHFVRPSKQLLRQVPLV